MAVKPLIGIFWVYQDTVIGKAVELSKGGKSVPGILDSEDTHIELWECKLEGKENFPELTGVPYEAVPRGRVLYDANRKKTMVYMDTKLFRQETKAKIAKYFRLREANTEWKKDPHYTTDANEVKKLFRT